MAILLVPVDDPPAPVPSVILWSVRLQTGTFGAIILLVDVKLVNKPVAPVIVSLDVKFFVTILVK